MKQTRPIDRILATVLVFVMVISLLPMSVFASTATHPDAFTVTVKNSSDNAPITEASIAYEIVVDGSTEKSGTAPIENGEAVIADVTEYADAIADEKTVELKYSVSATGFVTKTGTVSITDVTANVDVALEEEAPSEFTVSVVKNGPGTVKLDGAETNTVTVAAGSSVTITATPAEGAYIKAVTIAGTNQEIADPSSFEKTITVDADTPVSISFVNSYKVTVSKNDGGEVLLDGEAVTTKTVDENGTVNLSVTPEQGYQIATVSVNGSNETISDVTSFSKTLTVTEDTMITVAFVKVFTIVITYDEEMGNVVSTPECVGGAVTVETGTTIDITATPKETYRITKITITGEPDAEFSDNTYTHDNPYTTTLTADKDYTVEITFAPLVFTVTVNSPANGTVSVDKAKVDYDGTAIVTITPNERYTIESVTVNGINCYADLVDKGTDTLAATLTIANITEDKDIEVSFKLSEATPMENVSWNSADALRILDDSKTFIFAKDQDVVFSTTKQGIRITFEDHSTAGNRWTKSVTVSESKTISKIEVFYDWGWHEVKVEGESVSLTIVIDNLRPTLSLEPDPDAASQYDIYNDDVRVAVKVEDTGDYSGIASIEYWIAVDGTVTKQDNLFTYTDGEEIKGLFEGNIIVPAVDSDSVTVTMKAVDRAGNEDLTQIELKICKTKPTISVSIDGELHAEATTGYYNAARTATVTITDLAFCFDETLANNGITITAVDGNGISVPIAKTAMISWTDAGNVHTGKIEFTADANYEWEISYTNKADLSNDGLIAEEGESIYRFAVDTTAPTGTITVETDEWDDLLTALTFGIWKNYSISVPAEGFDVTSPLYDILYYKANSDVVLSETELIQLYENGEFVETTYTVSDDEQFAVYARITDFAGNTKYISTNGVIVDMTDSQITLNPDAPNGNGYYHGDVSVGIAVNDEAENGVYSGIKSIDYKVIANEGTENETITQEGNLYTFEVIESTDEQGHPTKDELCKEWTGSITVEAAKNNYDSVKVLITVTDNAGNVYSKYVVLAINITKPTMTISFGGDVANRVEADNGYFGQDRVATITIVDRASTFNEEAATAGISIVAVNGKNEAVTLDSSTMISEWSHKGDVHTATVTFSEDANYSWTLEYTNDADGSIEGINTEGCTTPFKFTVDKTAPAGSISVEESTWDTLLSILTFGLYKNDTVSVTETHEDETSPVTVEYYKTSDPYVLTAPALDEKYEADEFAVFEGSELQQNGVSPNEQFVIYLRITDYAGNYIYINSDGFIVDNAACEIVLTPDAPNTNGVYNKNVNVAIQVVDIESYAYSGIRTVDYWVEKDNQKTQEGNLFTFDVEHPAQGDLQEKWNGSIIVDAAKNNSCNVVVYVKAVDNAGNVSQKQIPLDIDVTSPEIEIRYNADRSNSGAKEGYYTARTATVTITERTHHFDADAATKGITISAKDINGKDISNAYSISAWTTTEGATPDAARHTATIRFTEDANYQFAIAYTDKADNANNTLDVTGQKTPYTFTVDTTAPTGTVTAKSAEGRTETWSDIVNPLTFGFWSKSKIGVTETHEDLTSPIASVQYYKPTAEAAADATTALNKESLDRITSWIDFPAPELSVSENAQFTVYIKITDYAGNYTYLSTNGLIVDDQHPIEESVAPEITVTPEQPINGIYKGDVKISISVNDPLVGGTYSGLKEISYKVFDRTSSTPDTATQEGVLFTFTNTNPLQTELQKTWTGEITVDSSRNNSNDIQVVIYAADNAGNAVDNSQKESQSYTSIKIDTTDPVITITPEQLTGYQNKQQTFTITVQERNFDESLKPNDVVNVSVKDIGVYPTFSNWEVRTGDGNGDTTTHTATVSFTQDGVYSFTADVTDLAGRKAAQKSVGEFTIDLTAPTISVSYDNNDAENGKYFDAPRTATVTIVEHNFDPSRVTFTPAQNVAWDNAGDKHTARVAYTEDGDYTFGVSAIDMADNQSEPVNYGDSVAATEFTVDTTFEEMVTISDVEDGKAYVYEDDVVPSIAIEDTNFDTYEVTLVGVQRGTTIDLTEEVNKLIEENANGITALFDVFRKTADYDGIYTLYVKGVDLAGNVDEEQVRFTINRFGSVYEYSDSLMSLIANGGTFNQSIDEDLTFTIYNASPIDPENISVVILRDGRPIEAVFTVTETTPDGDGWYSYLVTIDKSNFAEDGVYTVSVSAKDNSDVTRAIENTSDNSDGDIQFFVDSTAPQLTSVSGLEERIVNAPELEVSYTVYDTIGLASVQVKVDGEIVDTATDFDDASNYSGKFTIYEKSSAQHVSFVLTDKAGNVTESDAEGFEVPYTLEKDVTVSTNLFVRWFANKPLFFGGIGGGVAVLGGLGVLFGWKKKKTVKVS